MTDTPWTPGPWQATRSDPAEGADVFWITGHYEPGNNNSETEITSVPGNKPANAHLIAAAPLLFGELCNAREIIHDHVQVWSMHEFCDDWQSHTADECKALERALDAIDAALAKARGES